MTEHHKETRTFQTEVKELLHLMVHSLYSNKEVFLRELISNAADAIDKLRFEAISRDSLYEGESELKIEVTFDKESRTIKISDNGIGMSREEVIENIGTIARSGTRAFIKSLSEDQAKDANLIGQFGVGFYSAFIVADKVTLETRRAGSPSQEGIIWESQGEGEFTLETVDKPQKGTCVTLHLRHDEEEFLDHFRLKQIIQKFSDHIPVPIKMPTEKDADLWETVNRASALWTRPKKSIKESEYEEFYKHIAHDYDGPLTYGHNQVEGNLTYTSLFFIPKHAPFDLWDRDARHGVKLYVRRVFIMEDNEHFLPRYLRFVRGVIDCDDLPLNVSREILQNNKVVESLKAAATKRVLDMLHELIKERPEQYSNFWREFGKVLKEGPAEDISNRDRIAKLLRFSSTHNADDAQNVSLDDYIQRMKPGQKNIYYITGDSYQAVKNSPHLELFKTKGIETLLLFDRVDEWLVGFLTEYEGKSLQSVAKGDLDLGDLEDHSDKEALEKANQDLKPLVERLRNALGMKVKDVKVSHRLTDSPACLILEQQEMALHLQRLLKSAGHEMPHSHPILEINAKHPLMERLNKEQDSTQFAEWSFLLFDQAWLAAGGQLEDPSSFVKRMNELMLKLAGEERRIILPH